MPSDPHHPFPEYDRLSERASGLRKQLDRSRASLVEDIRWRRIADTQIETRRDEHLALVARVGQVQVERDAVNALLNRR